MSTLMESSDSSNLYAELADVYDSWNRSDPALEPSLQLYTALAEGAAGEVVELGIGTGRIAVAIALAGGRVLGIDSSPEMLERCRLRVEQLDTPNRQRIRLALADARTFQLEQPAALVLLPFRTVGHFFTACDRRALFENVYRNLAFRGRFVFDHYVFNEAEASRHDGVPQFLHAEDKSGDTQLRYWHTHRCIPEKGRLSCLLTVETIGAGGEVLSRRDFAYDLAWVIPDEVATLASECGFSVSALYGSFTREPFRPGSSEQVWVLEKRG